MSGRGGQQAGRPSAACQSTRRACCRSLLNLPAGCSPLRQHGVFKRASLERFHGWEAASPSRGQGEGSWQATLVTLVTVAAAASDAPTAPEALSERPPGTPKNSDTPICTSRAAMCWPRERGEPSALGPAVLAMAAAKAQGPRAASRAGCSFEVLSAPRVGGVNAPRRRAVLSNAATGAHSALLNKTANQLNQTRPAPLMLRKATRHRLHACPHAGAATLPQDWRNSPLLHRGPIRVQAKVWREGGSGGRCGGQEKKQQLRGEPARGAWWGVEASCGTQAWQLSCGSTCGNRGA